ncbi:MAG TPA: alternative ribosome rescue aminoacyl-tRNA hydrolase ArfB [Solirubrobacterales bacterium]
MGQGDGDHLHPLGGRLDQGRLRAGSGNRRPISERLRIDGRLSIPLAEVELRASRSSGPGGQHANVTASRVEAVFDVEASAALDEAQRTRLLGKVGPVVTAVAQDARSQARNRELALERLAEKIAAGLRVPRRRRPTKPTRAARERRLKQKRLASERKQTRRRPATED